MTHDSSNNYRVIAALLFILLPLVLWLVGPKMVLNELIPACKFEGIAEVGKSYRPHVKHCFPRWYSQRDAKPQNAEDTKLRVTVSKRLDDKGKYTGPNRYLQHLSFRFAFGTALVAVVIGAFAAILISIHQVLKAPMILPPGIVFFGGASLIAVVLAFELYFDGLMGRSDISKVVLTDPLKETAKLLTLMKATGASAFSEFSQTLGTWRTIAFFSVISGFLAIAVALAARTVLTDAKNEAALKENRKQLDIMLTVTAILFGLFVVYMRQYIQLAYPFIEQASSVKLLGDALVNYWAVSSSILLLCLFGLAFWHHKYQAAYLAETKILRELKLTRGSDEAKSSLEANAVKVAKVTEEAGANQSTWDMFMDVLKMFLPIIVGLGFDFKSLVGG